MMRIISDEMMRISLQSEEMSKIHSKTIKKQGKSTAPMATATKRNSEAQNKPAKQS